MWINNNDDQCSYESQRYSPFSLIYLSALKMGKIMWVRERRESGALTEKKMNWVMRARQEYRRDERISKNSKLNEVVMMIEKIRKERGRKWIKECEEEDR